MSGGIKVVLLILLSFVWNRSRSLSGERFLTISSTCSSRVREAGVVILRRRHGRRHFGTRRPAAEMNGLANRPRDAVANTGPRRALVLAVISIVVVATTAFLLRCTHPPPSQQRRHPFRRASRNSMRLFVSRGFAFSMAETTIVTRD
jgi:hypothetical protein